MTENNLYSLNQVKPCNKAPQNIQMNEEKLNMYTKHFRTEINATICRIKHQKNKFLCGMHDHTSMDIEQPQIASDIDFLLNNASKPPREDHLLYFTIN